MKALSKILWWFIYALPAVLFFSYHPIISLGANDSMNFELSLPLIWLLLFDLGAFVLLLILRSHQPNQLPGISDRRFFLLAIFPLYLTLSVFWSDNPLRGLLTAGIVWLIFFAIFAMLYILPLTGTPRRLRTHVLFVMFASAVLVCKYCYAQSIMDILGLDRGTTLLCAGCTYRSFGFPHPSGFAIEPQFMGNLLLAPTITALYLVAFRSRKFANSMVSEANYLENKVETQVLRHQIHLPKINWNKWKVIGMTILAGFLSMTLFFTFSRGAIYAYSVALIILIIFALRHKEFRWSLITIPVVSFLFSLALQGTFAAVGPTAETFVSGVTKSIHQLSLGLIDLRPKGTTSSVENSTTTVENNQSNCGKDVQNSPIDCAKPVENSTTQPSFDGYVPESTNIRLSLNQTALQTWSTDPARIFFGVGLGGAGTAMHNAYPDRVTSPKEIVQHQGFSLLLETGLVGVILCIFGLLIALAPNLFPHRFLDGRSAEAGKTGNHFWYHPVRPLLLALVIAYLITLNFFSGLPNALQIYLMPPLLYLVFQRGALQKAIIIPHSNHPSTSAKVSQRSPKSHKVPLKS